MTGLLLSAFASPFESTELLEAEDLVVPTENLILYDQRWRPMRPVSTAPDLPFFSAGTRRDFSVIAKDLRLAHTRDALAQTGRW